MAFETARWIASQQPISVPVFKRSFELNRLPAVAKINITGLGYFEAYINGIPLTDERLIPAASDYLRRDFSAATYPVRDCFTHRIYYHTFNITDFLQRGKNELKIICGGGWFVQTERIAEGRMSYSDRPQCIYEIDLDGAIIPSDGSESCSECEIRKSELFIGEIIDLGYQSEKENSVITLPSPDTVMTLSDAVPDRIIRKITPMLISEGNGKRIYDVGENVSALVRLTVNAKAGEKYVLRFAEFLSSEGNLDFTFTGSNCIGASGKPQIMEDVFISGGGRAVFMPKFTWHSFRYFEICGDFPSIENVEVCVLHSDVSLTAEFESDSEGLNFLFDAYVRTQLSNYHGSFPSDCPHRERLGYTGDGQICAKTAMMLFDSKGLYRKWIRDILDSQDIKSGHIQHTAPFQGGGGGPGGWCSAVVTVPYAYIRQFGDKSILTDTLPAMRRFIDFTAGCIENGLVVRECEGGWCLGDWLSLDEARLPEAFVNTCWFIHALRLYRDMSDTSDPKIDELEQLCLNAVKNEYDKLRHIGTATVYAVFVGIESPSVCASFYNALGHFDTGFLATDILMDILFSNGFADVAYKLLSSRAVGSFLYMKDRGATTLFESWECNGSGSHPMFGACTRQLFEGVLGIRQAPDSVGFEKISILPSLPQNMNYARGSILTPRGCITVSLERKDGVVHIKTSVPKEITLISENPKNKC